MTNTLTSLRKTRFRILAAALAICLALVGATTVMPMRSAAAETDNASSAYATPAYQTYDLGVLADGSQSIELVFHYDGAVSVIAGAQSTIITIGNSTVASSRINLAGDGNDFVVSIAPDSRYPSIGNGLLTFECNMAGVTIDGVPATAIAGMKTVIPIGVAFSSDSQGSEEVTVDIADVPHTNGMIHVGIYYEDNGSLVPIWANPNSHTDPIDVYTFTSYMDSYDPDMRPTPYAVAKLIQLYVSTDSNFGSDYEITADGDYATDEGSLTVTNDLEQDLYVLVFDDILLQDLNVTYSDVLDAGGVLPGIPSCL